jgi:hypothetical protein
MVNHFGNFLRGFGATLILCGFAAMAGSTLADGPGGGPGGGGISLDCHNIICENACSTPTSKPDCCNEGQGQCDHCKCKWVRGLKWCEVGCS